MPQLSPCIQKRTPEMSAAREARKIPISRAHPHLDSLGPGCGRQSLGKLRPFLEKVFRRFQGANGPFGLFREFRQVPRLLLSLRLIQFSLGVDAPDRDLRMILFDPGESLIHVLLELEIASL